MADFPYLSSPESNDSAVEDIISQATDLYALEQIAALNSCHVSDSVLPTALETRFLKLKSFPGANPKLKNPPPSLTQEKTTMSNSLNQFKKAPTSSPDEETDFQSQFLSVESMKPEILSQRGELKISDQGKRSPHSSSNKENEILNHAKGQNSKSRTGSASSPSGSSSSSWEASSPPRQICCFWCSPKKVPRKKSKENRDMGFDLDIGDWEKNDAILSDLGTFSLKDKKQMLKKALKEEEKVSREAEKVVKWVKQASARMDVSTIDYSLSDDDQEIFK
ncbi:uncharacterized protein LOC143876439 [Tasmannia lanceolata]|uniref:uncharacterized protein LOC143876439 n=1 Tax=Tasmannia lanceolata TaxID=3420 RepID=UPI004063A66A